MYLNWFAVFILWTCIEPIYNIVVSEVRWFLGKGGILFWVDGVVVAWSQSNKPKYSIRAIDIKSWCRMCWLIIRWVMSVCWRVSAKRFHLLLYVIGLFRTYSISTLNVYSFAGYRSDLGPICYGCDQQLTTDSCDTITQCGIDEVRTKHS